MATGPERWNNLPAQGGPARRGKAQPEKNKDIYLCVAFFVLLAWALAVGLGVWK